MSQGHDYLFSLYRMFTEHEGRFGEPGERMNQQYLEPTASQCWRSDLKGRALKYVELVEYSGKSGALVWST